MGLFGGSAQDDVDLRNLQERVARLEQTVARLEAQLLAAPAVPAPDGVAAPAPTGPPPWMAEVLRLVAQGKKINAIKVYREHTGVGLKEAKDAVERLP